MTEIEKKIDKNENSEVLESSISSEEIKNEEEVLAEKSEDGLGFVYLNRVITNLLTSLISAGLVIASLFGVEAMFGAENLTNLDIRSVIVFLLFSGLSLYLGQILQNYFVKIIEKESYKYVLGKTFKNFVWQVLLVAMFIPGLIYALSLGEVYVFWGVGLFVFTSGLIAMSIREAEHANRLQAGIFGGFLSALFWLTFSFSLYTGGTDTWRFALLALLPITAIVSEIVIILADMISQYIKD